MKKDELMLELFFNYPSKQWHFEDILNSAKISRPQASIWLKNFVKLGIVKRIKEKEKMPYYLANYNNANYQIKKRFYALQELEKTGFMKHLVELPEAKTVILFGSFNRWDWYKDSDIDLFIYGSDNGLNLVEYRKKLNREIQTFICKSPVDVKKFNSALLRNIVEGYCIKGYVDFIKVMPNA